MVGTQKRVVVNEPSVFNLLNCMHNVNVITMTKTLLRCLTEGVVVVEGSGDSIFASCVHCTCKVMCAFDAKPGKQIVCHMRTLAKVNISVCARAFSIR